nr:PREDICTED: ornithine aminotransferase, mitochondrial-like isoform X1 [Bemisia tabaci]
MSTTLGIRRLNSKYASGSISEKMAMLQKNSAEVVRHLGLVGNASLPRLISTTVSLSEPAVPKAATSKEVFEREYKSTAHNYDPLPVAISKGEGVYMWDVDGKKYLDFFAGYATLSHGHCHPTIVEAMRKQVGILHHTSRAIYHDKMYEFAEYITKKFNFDKVLTMNTGAEGGETAVKLARKWGYRVKKIPENKAKTIFAHGNFWGRTIAAISSSSSPTSKDEFGPHVPEFHNIPYNDIPALEEKLKDPHVCAFMVEPIQGEAGAVVPDEGYLKKVRELCTKYNVLWIADEVQTGLCRTGKFLAVHHENVKPDILILGKALSGGVMPVSAVLADDPVMEVFTPGTHGSTYGGNPLACHLGIVSLESMTEGKFDENAKKMGDLFMSELSSRLDRKKVPIVRGRGLLNAIVVDPEQIDTKYATIAMRDRGLITKHINEKVIRFSPALIITEEQMRAGIDIIVDALNNFKMPAK